MVTHKDGEPARMFKARIYPLNIKANPKIAVNL